MKKERSSNIEILRILSMLMIIAFHWQLHGNNDGIIYSAFSSKQAFSFFWGSWGSLGVDIFFIISSFFGVQSYSLKISRLVPIVVKVSLYGVFVLSCLNIFDLIDFNILETIKSFLGVFAYQYWFISVYVVLYCLHPALNKMMYFLSEKYFIFLVIVLFYSTYVIGFVYINEFVGRLSCGITIYLLVGFFYRFPKYNVFSNYGGWISLLGMSSICLGECFLSFLSLSYGQIFCSIINRIQIITSPFMVIVAFGIFYRTLPLQRFHNNIINFLGKYSVGAYLLHGGSSSIKDVLWDDILNVAYFFNNTCTFVYVVYYIVCTFLFFFIGCIIDFFVSIFVNKLIALFHREYN